MNVICVKGLNLTLGRNHILKNINVNFEEGKIHGLIGRNGSGKTMLLKSICGFISIQEGEIRVGDKLVGKEVDFPKNVGIIIETPDFIPYYSGLKNLMFLASINGIIDKKTVQDAMEMVGLDPHSKLAVRKYSLGMKQRLGLAQAIMENPDILILDEPFNGLDKDGVKEMRNYLLMLKKLGKTIIIASHSSEDISILCDEVYEMEKGVLEKISCRN